MANQLISVGIIANPASGSDIRRLVALGSVFGTQEKINIVQRTLVGLATAGVDQVYIMPDYFHIGATALEKLPQGLSGIKENATLLDMQVKNSAEDSLHAVRLMANAGVGCIIVLGGDGTSRVAAKGCANVPILPISTGTNNVIAYPVEGTMAGLAAGFIAHFPERMPEVAYRSKWLEVRIEGEETDMALVDVAIVTGQYVGSRAIWEPEKLKQVILTRSEPRTTGISGLSGFIETISPLEPRGLHVFFGEPRIFRVAAPLAPGLIAFLDVQEIRNLLLGEMVIVQGEHFLLALDGEREIPLRRGQFAQIYLRSDGPWIVDVFKTLEVAAQSRIFVN